MREPHRPRDVFSVFDDLEREYGVQFRARMTAADADRARHWLVTRYRAVPLLRRLAERCPGEERRRLRGSPGLTQPSMALAAQRSWGIVMAGDIVPVRLFDGYDDAVPDTIARMRLAASLVVAQTYLWSAAI